MLFLSRVIITEGTSVCPPHLLGTERGQAIEEGRGGYEASLEGQTGAV